MNNTKCPLCSKSEYIDEVSYNKLFKNKIYYCKDCILSFDYPPPSLEILNEYYENISNDIHKGKVSTFSKGHKVKRWLRAYSQFYFINKYFSKSNNNFLFIDFGCGLGQLISLLDESNYKVAGIEPNFEYRKNAPSNVKEKIYKDFSGIVEEDSEVVLILSHVLEHLNNPEQFLDSMLAKFKVKYIFVEQPLIHSNFFQYVVQKNKLGGEHIIMFSEKSLSKFFELKDYFPQDKIEPKYSGIVSLNAKGYIEKDNLRKQLINSHKSHKIRNRLINQFINFTGFFLGAKLIAKLTVNYFPHSPKDLATVLTNIFVYKSS